MKRKKNQVSEKENTIVFLQVDELMHQKRSKEGIKQKYTLLRRKRKMYYTVAAAAFLISIKAADRFNEANYDLRFRKFSYLYVWSKLP